METDQSQPLVGSWRHPSSNTLTHPYKQNHGGYVLKLHPQVDRLGGPQVDRARKSLWADGGVAVQRLSPGLVLSLSKATVTTSSAV